MGNIAKEQPVDFGFRKVPRGKKAELIGGIFSDVAGKYDLMKTGPIA